jgi:predicted nucleic acid-binding protein
MVFLDANPVVYLIEQPAVFGPKVTARVTALLAIGERLAVSDLVRMECQVGPLKANDQVLLAQYVAFFQAPDVSVLNVSPAVCDRAARIRAQYGFKPLDSLHLAAAVEHRCALFLTSDAQLKRFPDIPVEILS